MRIENEDGSTRVHITEEYLKLQAANEREAGRSFSRWMAVLVAVFGCGYFIARWLAS